MVTRLPDPGLVPTSQEAGGSTHGNSAMTAPGSSPGFDAGVVTYNVSTDAPGPAMPAAIPVSDEADRVRDNGRPVQTGGWTQVPGVSR